jgi:hypothetical protein
MEQNQIAQQLRQLRDIERDPYSLLINFAAAF